MASLPRIGRRAAAVGALGVLVTTLGTGVATAKPAGPTGVIRIIAGVPQTITESNGTAFQCPTNYVMIGRAHSGDENGGTTYYCARILIDGYQVTVNPEPWTNGQKESTSSFTAPEDEVIIGRQHSGDENGNTSYRTAYLTYQGRELTLQNQHTVGPYRESSSSSTAAAGELMVGRSHSGDENGNTYYQYAALVG
ncbi:hypothetical protein [Streptomyces sp. NBC_01477]|uniref:hypothetical protein n=1 Tax=Streptomyces sp. NBC_01477 TaxID=2976015 RepID=UPI002E368F82|nr:hypothetical protein [Streptomyces sp. NBC_01477]